MFLAVNFVHLVLALMSLFLLLELFFTVRTALIGVLVGKIALVFH